METLESSNHPFAVELRALCDKYKADFTIENRWDKCAHDHVDKIIVTIDPIYDDEGELISKNEIEIITI